MANLHNDKDTIKRAIDQMFGGAANDTKNNLRNLEEAQRRINQQHYQMTRQRLQDAQQESQKLASASSSGNKKALREVQQVNRRVFALKSQANRQALRMEKQRARIENRLTQQAIRADKQQARAAKRAERQRVRAAQRAQRQQTRQHNSIIRSQQRVKRHRAAKVHRQNKVTAALRSRGVTPEIIADLGEHAAQNMNKPLPNTAHAHIQYGRSFLRHGHSLMSQVNSLTHRMNTFSTQIERVKGRYVTAGRNKRFTLYHRNYANRASDVRSHLSHYQTFYHQGLSQALNTRSKLANKLPKYKGIHMETDKNGNKYIPGSERDPNTSLGIVSRMAKNGNKQERSEARSYLGSNRTVEEYIDNFGSQLHRINTSMSKLDQTVNNMNSNFGNYSNGLTTSEAQARFNPNATYLHYPSSTPTGMIQDMGGPSGIITQGAFSAGSAISNYVGQGNALRQQIEPGINSLSLGNAINGGTDQYHLDNGITDRLMQEGRWNGQTANQMSQYLGALGGTRNTNPTEQTQAAGNEAQFSRNTNVNPTDTSQLFSTLANGGGLGDRNDRGNIVDFTRQFAGMLHNDHLGSVSGQQAQGLNSIFGSMVGSGQTLTPSVVRNITAMQGVLSSGPGGRAFQGQQGAQQLNNFSQGVGSQFGNMLVRNAFAGANPRYGGQQGLYQLGLDMKEPLKHPQQLTGMIQNLASSGLGPAGTQLELTQMGLSPDAAKQMYNQVMSGKLNPGSLKKIEQQNNAQGGSTESHTNKQYRMQGNSTLDIKVAMGQQGKLHSSEAFDSTRNGMNYARSVYDRSGSGAMLAQGGRGISHDIANAANVATLVGMFTGRGGGQLGNSKINPRNWSWIHKLGIGKALRNSKHPTLRKFGQHLNNVASNNSGSGGAINSHGNRFSNNYFYNNHFMGGSGGSSSGSGDNGTGNGSDNSSSSSSDNSSNSSSGNSSDDTDNEAHDDKESDLKDERDKALKNGDKGKAKELDQHIADLERDKRNGGGLGDRAMRWLGHDRTGRAISKIKGGRFGNLLTNSAGHLYGSGITRKALNWVGHGTTGNIGRSIFGLGSTGMTFIPKGSKTVGSTGKAANIATATTRDAATAKTASRGGGLLRKGKDLLRGGALLKGGRAALRAGSTTSELSGVGMVTNAAISGGLALSDFHNVNGGNFGAKTGQALGDAAEGIPGLGLLPLRTIGGMAGYTLQHPIRAMGRVGNGIRDVGHFIAHPYRSTQGIRNKARYLAHRGLYHAGNFVRHPFRSIGRGVRGIGRLGLAGLRGVGNFAHGIFGGAMGGALRGLRGLGNIGGLGRTILGRGGSVALVRNYMYLRMINRMLPRLASKLEGLFGESGLSGNKGSSSNASGMQNAQENAESVSQNNGNTTNNDNSNHDDHSTNNYFMGYPGQGGTGAQSLTTPMMDFFSHSHGTAAS